MMFLIVNSTYANNVMTGAISPIVPDGSSILTTVSETGSIIKITGGERRDTNLFHSFDRFSVEIGKTAIFFNETNKTTHNIISRVTGNIRSNIDGIIRANKASGFEDANFFLLNPAGVTLGSGARLEMDGSIHLSTADYIRLGKRETFNANLNSKSTLTMANVMSFGFLKSTANKTIPSSILFEEDTVFTVKEGETIFLAGGDITIIGGGLKAPGGKINIVSAANGEEISRVDPSSSVTIHGMHESIARGEVSIIAGNDKIIPFLGTITPNPTNIDVTSTVLDSGSILIIGGVITINQSKLSASSADNRNAGNITLNGNTLSMLNGARADVGASGGGITGNIDFTATESVELIGEGIVDTFLFAPSTPTTITASNSGNQDAGNIEIKTTKLNIFDNAAILTISSGEGIAGSIILNVNSLNIDGDGEVFASTSNSGNGGRIIIKGYDGIKAAENVNLISGKISTNTDRSGNGGDIVINADQVNVDQQGAISSATTLQGQGGNITISNAQLVNIKGKITTDTSGKLENAGDAGNVLIQADQLLVYKGGTISSQTSSDGDAGNIEIIAKNQTILSSKGSISTKSTSLGNAGKINFKTFELQLNNASITTEASQSDGGDITIEGNSPANLVSLNNDSAITATVGGGAQTIGGNINIDSNLIVVQNSNIIAEASEGAGGNIDINTQGLFVDPDSRISASSQLGVDGTVEIDSDIEVLDGVLGLPETYMSNLRLRQQRCSQRLGGGKGSSFTTVEKPGMAITPETFLSGDYNTNSNSETHFSKAALDIKSLASLNEQYEFNCRN